MDKSYRNNPNSLFRKYAYLITTLARKHDIFREFVTRDSSLVVPKDVSLLLPNGYQEFDGRQGRLTITTRPIYSPHLSPILQKLDLYAPYIQNFQEAQDMVMFLTRETKQKPAFIPYKEMPRLFAEVMFTTTTFNPDADPESTSIDGHAQRGSVDQTFANIRAGAGTSADTASVQDSGAELRASTTTNQYQSLRRNFFLFDSSSLPDTDNIDAGSKVSIYVDAVLTDIGNTDMDLVDSTPASNTDIVASDYANIGTTRQATGVSISGMSTTAYNDWTLNATGRASVSKTGITKFGTRNKWDVDNSFTGTWASGARTRATITLGDNGSNKPILSVVHTQPTAAAAQGYAYFM